MLTGVSANISRVDVSTTRIQTLRSIFFILKKSKVF